MLEAREGRASTLVATRPTVPSPWRIGVYRRPTTVTPGAPHIEGPFDDKDAIALPSNLYPKRNSTWFNPSVNQAITGANTQYTPSALVVQLTPAEVGVVHQIDLLLDGIVATSNVLWQVMVNGAALAGYEALTILGRSGAASVSKTIGPYLGILLPQGARLSVKIVDIDGGAYTAGCGLVGWKNPVAR